jgi:hypothetical protein
MLDLGDPPPCPVPGSPGDSNAISVTDCFTFLISSSSVTGQILRRFGVFTRKAFSPGSNESEISYT